MENADEKKPPEGGVFWLEWFLACKNAGLLADPAEHDRVLHLVAKIIVIHGPDANQVHRPAVVARKPLWVLFRKSAQLVRCKLAFQVRFLKVRLQHHVKCFKIFYLRGHKGEVLAQRRRAAALVNQFHKRVKKRMNHDLWLALRACVFSL